MLRAPLYSIRMRKGLLTAYDKYFKLSANNSKSPDRFDDLLSIFNHVTQTRLIAASLHF